MSDAATPPVVRVLVAEDSATTREYLVFLLVEAGGFDVVGTARDGIEAVERTECLRPHVVLMDVHMPRMNGYEAASRIMECAPTPIVMVSASFDRDEVGMTFEALRAGALAVVDKPRGFGHAAQGESARQLVTTLRLMAEVRVVRRWPRRPAPGAGSPPRVARDRRARVVAIGASTGGPAALAEILGKLPGDLGAPVLVVQHIAPGFIPGLAGWLAGQTRLGVKVAEPGEPLRPATVYVAPDDRHLGPSAEGRVRLTSDPPEGGFRPSASFLMRAVAETYAASSVGVLLTGMGEDGVTGLRRLRDAGAVTVAQDEQSSVVFGMPREAIRLGAAEHVLPPEDIAALVSAVVGSR